MALAAGLVDLGGGEATRVTDVGGGGCGSVGAAGSVAGLAADALFSGLHCPLRRQSELAGGMALKATQDVGIGAEGGIANAGRVGVAGREGERLSLAVPGEAVFDVMVFVRGRDVGDGLGAGAKGPTAVSTALKGAGMMSALLFLHDLGVTGGAGFRSGEILRHQD